MYMACRSLVPIVYFRSLLCYSHLRLKVDVVTSILNWSQLCLSVSNKSHLCSLGSLIVYLLVLKCAFLSTFPCSLCVLSFTLEVSIATTCLGPAITDLVVPTFLFEEKINVGFWEVLMVVLTLVWDLLWCAGLPEWVQFVGEKADRGEGLVKTLTSWDVCVGLRLLVDKHLNRRK